MRFWMSGEIESDVYDAYDIAEKTIEREICQCIAKKSYGDGLKLWAYLAVILEPGTEKFYPEVKRYSKRKKEIEFRLKIDHQQFLQGDHKAHLKLLSESVLRCLELMRDKRIKDFDLDRLTKDVTQCLSTYLE